MCGRLSNVPQQLVPQFQTIRAQTSVTEYVARVVWQNVETLNCLNVRYILFLEYTIIHVHVLYFDFDFRMAYLCGINLCKVLC